MFKVVLQSWGASVTAPITGGVDGCPLSWGASDTPVMPPSDAKVSFFDNLVKKQQLEFLEKIFCFLYLSLSLILPQKGKMLWCSHFRSFIKLAIFSGMGNFIAKLNFVSTPWKFIIPLENSVGDYIRVIEIHLHG